MIILSLGGGSVGGWKIYLQLTVALQLLCFERARRAEGRGTNFLRTYLISVIVKKRKG